MGHAEDERGRPKALLIAGPTASGKSALAMRLARRLGGVVVNADSMQVYRDLRILSARPSDADMAEVPHALYGTIDAAQNYSVSLWLADVKRELACMAAAGALPIFVGGTGLYFKALTQSLSDIPAIPEPVRQSVRAWGEGRPAEALHAELERRDPETARKLRPTDPQRLLRALEVLEATSVGLAGHQGHRAAPLLAPATWSAVALMVDRAELRARIDARFDAMVEGGALTEVAALEARQLDPALPAMRAIGVPQLLRHLRDEVGLAAAIDNAKLASRQYVKRQETFARHQLPAFRAVPPDEAEGVLLSACQSS